MASDIDAIQLSRTLSAAAESASTWHRALKELGGLDMDPFARHRSSIGQSKLLAVQELPEYDPLRLPLLRWIFRLLEARINRETTVRLAVQLRGELFELQAPVQGRWSLGAMRFRALADERHRDAWWNAIGEHGSALAETTAHLWQRRAEIARRLELDSFDSLIAPSWEERGFATSWLDASKDLMELPRGGAAWAETALGTAAADAFPGRLSPDWVLAPFRGTDLLKGLNVHPGALCPALGAASFARGLARFGAALSRAGAPRDQPFVIAQDPFGLRQSVWGGLFAGLLMNPSFAKRALGLGSARADELCREMATCFLVESRVTAVRILLRNAALASESEYATQFEELSEEHLGLSHPRSLLGTFATLRVDDPQRIVSLPLSLARSITLRDTHDEDWYRNPRACEQLRDELARPPETSVDQTQLRAAFSELEKFAKSTLG